MGGGAGELSSVLVSIAFASFLGCYITDHVADYLYSPCFSMSCEKQFVPQDDRFLYCSEA